MMGVTANVTGLSLYLGTHGYLKCVEFPLKLCFAFVFEDLHAEISCQVGES